MCQVCNKGGSGAVVLCGLIRSNRRSSPNSVHEKKNKSAYKKKNDIKKFGKKKKKTVKILVSDAKQFFVLKITLQMS